MNIALHVGGVPVEELLPAAAGAGAALLAIRAWLGLHVRRRRARPQEAERPGGRRH